MPVRQRHHRRTVLRVILVAELVIALVTATTVAFAYNNLDGNIETLPEIVHPVPAPEPGEEGEPQPLNILVMGSDTRAGEGNRIDGETGQGARSDTTMLLHVSADRQTAYGVSLARDTVVDRPDCRVGDETIQGAQDVMFNEAFSVGGPLCTIQQVETITGIHVHHTVVIDFNGFTEMVDAVDGVEVCIPKDVDDPAHDIRLEAGTRLISGDEALDYVRERHYLSVNSDVGRMKRQQAFVASMIGRVMSAGTIANPRRLYDFLEAATDSVQLDEDLASLGKIYHLARELRNIDLRRIRFATVPIEAYPPDPNRLQFAPGAQELWKAIRTDAPLGKFARGSISADDEPSGDPADAADRLANGLCA